MTNPLLIAMHLPQFHPIPENDQWWGKGFTEWTNVTKAKSLFKGHYQPHLPSDLGYYDLRLPEARAAQAELAKRYGIGGFCYYHYWFNGHRLLNRPVDEILQSGAPDFPFSFCWANENWTRAWDGKSREMLMAQHYSKEDDIRHIEHLLPFFADPRYTRIDGRPLFIVYRPEYLPEPRRTFALWRERAIKAGIGDLYLAQLEASGYGSAQDPRTLGLDVSIEFAPDWRRLGGRYYATRKARFATSLGLLPRAYQKHTVVDYARVVDMAISKPAPDYPFVRCVCPGFDNTARRSSNGAYIFRNSTPERYEKWLHAMLAWTDDHDITKRRVVFINAWNEWAEGNHLEPDTRHGHAYLEATYRALENHALEP